MNKESMPGPEELARIQKENLTDEQIELDKEREHDLIKKLEDEQLSVINSFVGPGKQDPKELFSLVHSPNLTKRAGEALVDLIYRAARELNDRKTPFGLSGIDINRLEMALVMDPNISPDIVHIAVDKLGSYGSKIFEEALNERDGEVGNFPTGDMRRNLLPKTLVLMIKRDKEGLDKEKNVRTGQTELEDKFNVIIPGSHSDWVYDIETNMHLASVVLEERIRDILSTHSIEQLPKMLDISEEDYENHVKPIVEEAQKPKK